MSAATVAPPTEDAAGGDGADGLAALSLGGVSCAAGTRPLFRDVDLDIRAGAWILLSGPNGSGKSTLLRMIAGLVRPLAGSLSWQSEQQDPRSLGWRSRLLYEGHAAGLKAEFTARENLAWQLAPDEGRPATPATLDDALARVGLTRARHVAGARLSAGQQRRVLLARLACSTRPVWLLDEPANALDAGALELLAGLLDEHLGRGGCALVASHQALPTRHPPHRLRLGPQGVEALSEAVTAPPR